MKSHFECHICLLNRIIRLIERFEPDDKRKKKIMRDIHATLARVDYDVAPAYMGMLAYRTLRELLGDIDLFREEKDESNRLLMELYPEFEKRIAAAPDPFSLAIKYSAAGNIIDLGAFKEVDIISELERLLKLKPAIDETQELKSQIERAKKVLIIGDNCGEIVLDKLLVRQIGGDKTVYAVRDKPVINDATLREAEMAGMTKLCRVISNGSDGPGVVLEEASEEFLAEYRTAEVIISKGQGNFETLFGERDKNIYFVFLVKCAHVERQIGIPQKRAIIGSLKTLHTRPTP